MQRPLKSLLTLEPTITPIKVGQNLFHYGMANLIRIAKSGSEWTGNELLAFNIRVANANTASFFNTTQLPPAHVSDTILDNIHTPGGQLQKEDRLFFRYLELVETLNLQNLT
jgi:hypothetical protein